MPEVVNLQKEVRIETASIKRFCKVLRSGVSEVAGKAFTVAFITDDRMKQLNSLFRGKDSTTDVLSFPNEPGEFGDQNSLGDIIISAEQAERQAKDNDLTLDNEIKQLCLHGLLHLCGYDHETDSGEMDKREVELRKALDI